MLKLLRADQAIPPGPEEEDGPLSFEELWDQLNKALYEQNGPETLAAVLNRVKDAARNVRDRLSLDSWRVINRLEGYAEAKTGDQVELLDDTLFTLSSFSGLAMESMTRGLGWRFMDMGRRVERAIHQTNLIKTGLSRILHESRSDLEALLEVSDSIMTYRARYRTTFQPAPVLDLLLVDESNPKSLAFQCSRLAVHVDHPPRLSDRRFSTAEERMALEMLRGAPPGPDRSGAGSGGRRKRFPDLVPGKHGSPAPGFRPAGQRPLPEPGADHAPLLHDRRWSTTVKYRLVHKTVYRYSEPASLSQNELFLEPRETASQRVIQCRVDIQPEPQYLHRRIDNFGNRVQVFMVQ